MSTLVDVKEKWSAETSGMNVSERTAGKGYTVLWDQPGTDLAVASRTAEGIPRHGSVHPADDFLVVIDVQVSPVSQTLYDVDVTYGTPSHAGFRTVTQDDGQDTLDLRPQIRWTHVESEESVDHDVNGDPITTVGGSNEIITLQKRFADPMLIVRRYRPSFDAALMVQYMGEGGATNSDAFLGTVAGQALLTKMEADLVYFGPYEIYSIEYNVMFRGGFSGNEDKAWYTRHANRGFKVKSGSNYIRATDDNGNNEVTPVLLKSDGTRETNSANTHWIYTQMFPSLPFAPLGIL
jgi:hypothetical protein